MNERNKKKLTNAGNRITPVYSCAGILGIDNVTQVF